MSAVCVKLLTLLCLFCTALSSQEKGGVVWRDLGGSITIQCRSPQPRQEFLTLKSGLMQGHLFFKEINTETQTIAEEYQGRLQSHGVFPSMDILIMNLTSDDTGPYWCIYSAINNNTAGYVEVSGEGSMQLVVTDTVKQCEGSNNTLVHFAAGISAVILLIFFMGFIIWIIFKTKSKQQRLKRKKFTSNEVYEDMRGTLRR